MKHKHQPKGPDDQLSLHRRSVAAEAKKRGVRYTSRLSGVGPMLVSRFIRGEGGDDAATLYRLAFALGWVINLDPAPTKHLRRPFDDWLAAPGAGPGKKPGPDADSKIARKFRRGAAATGRLFPKK